MFSNDATRTFFAILVFVLVSVVETTEVKLETITTNERNVLVEWCPSVDICDQNATSAILKLNGELRRKGYISCCSGCSCHPDCKERLNCCHPKADEDKRTRPKYACLNTRISNSSDVQPNDNPSYVTVIAPPPDGCKDNKPLRVSKDIFVNPTCDEVAMTPWSSYYPVYSKTADEIFKNILCARCHGFKDAEVFSSKLICKKFDRELDQMTPLTQHARTVVTGMLADTCHVDFKHENSYEISNKLCFPEVVDTCAEDDFTSRDDPSKINMTHSQIKELCENGIKSPIADGQIKYKNVFCYLCRHHEPLACRTVIGERQGLHSFTYVLNPASMLSHAQIHGKMKPLKTVCLKNDLVSVEGRCRELHCPSGKIRNEDGDCILISKQWFSGGHLLDLKLTPVNRHQVLGAQEMEEIGKSLIKSSPWSPQWSIVWANRRDDTTVCVEKSQFLIHLVADIKNPDELYQDVMKTLSGQWTTEFNGTKVSFHQSLLEYDVNANRTKTNLYPHWQWAKLDFKSSDGKFFGCGPIIWKRFYQQNPGKSLRPGKVIKLIYCEQIQLESEEFVLEHDNTYLNSNLTTSVLHEREFEILEDGEGLHARVCLTDSKFSTPESNKGSGLGAALFIWISVSTIIQLVASRN